MSIPTLLWLTCAASTTPVVSPEETGALALQRRVIDIYDSHHGAVVRVKAIDQPGPAGSGKVVQRFCTGFFVSREGHVITNANVSRGAERIWIIHRDIPYLAEAAGHDQATNISVVKLDELPPEATFIPLGDAPELPPVGTLAVRISSPLEFAPSPAFGLVAGHESFFTRHVFPCTYLRTSIPGGPGEGGSPLFDVNGRLIGVMVASLADLQGSYAIPVRAARRVRDDLLFSGSVTYGWFGFEISERVTVADGRRVILREIIPGTGAERAGLRAGDTLVSVDGYPTRDVNHVRNAMFYSRPGQVVPVAIERGGRALEVGVKVGTRPEDEPLVVPVPGTGEEGVGAAVGETGGGASGGRGGTDDTVPSEAGGNGGTSKP